MPSTANTASVSTTNASTPIMSPFGACPVYEMVSSSQPSSGALGGKVRVTLTGTAQLGPLVDAFLTISRRAFTEYLRPRIDLCGDGHREGLPVPFDGVETAKFRKVLPFARIDAVRNRVLIVCPAYIRGMHITRHLVAEEIQPQPIGNIAPTLPAGARLPDGSRSWGSFDAVVGQYGVRHYRLRIYPPGTGVDDRCAARLWQCWPIGGATLVVLAEMLLGDVVASIGVVFVFAAGIYLAAGALLFLRGGPARVPVRSMTVVLMPRTADVQALCRYTYWRALVDMLTDADHRLVAGDISAVRHEAIWREAYNRLAEWSSSRNSGLRP